MFSKKEAGYKEGVDTLVGINTVFTGNVESDGTVRVDGKIRGDIKVGGDVFIGESAVITGGISALNVHLAGIVEGNITCRGILKILATAKLYGDIKVNSFVADEGALFQGKCSMMEPAEETDRMLEKNPKKNYKKSSVLDDVYDEKEKSKELKGE